MPTRLPGAPPKSYSRRTLFRQTLRERRAGVVPVWSGRLHRGRKPAFLHEWRFPARNRIVAGLAKATVVVEARDRSGALITADFALELGRDVFAVPGEITSGLSKGTNDLIRQGATPLLAAADVLESLGVEPSPPPIPASLSPEANAVLAFLADGAATLDEISRGTDLGSPEVAVALTELELAGLVVGGDGLYRVRSSSPGGRGPPYGA
jgi:DNA processing protein